jgi:hypothetical protein
MKTRHREAPRNALAFAHVCILTQVEDQWEEGYTPEERYFTSCWTLWNKIDRAWANLGK